MEEVTTAQTPPEQPSEMSFTDKIMNVFSAPGELFENVAKAEKRNSNWSVPLVVAMIVSIVFILVAFSQAPIQDQMREQTEKTIQKQVASGKLTQEQADMALSKNPAQPGSPLFMIFGSIAAAAAVALMLFGFALAFWLMGKWVFKSTAPYGKVLEVVGLSMYISILMSIVTLLLVVAMGSLYASPSLAIALPNFDPSNKIDKLLASINAGTFWFLAVISVGLGKVFAVPTMKALVGVGVLWALWTAGTVLIGFAG